jgi:N-acetylglucosaminyldiphosphoundecaprenol N-acetyl-beta-D-mannosaminyltransferase
MRQLIGPTTLFDGLSVYSGTKESLLSSVSEHISKTEPKTHYLLKIFTPNPEQMVLAKEDTLFYKALFGADVLLPDGAGLVWAINRGKGKKERIKKISGRDVFHDILEMAREKNWKVFLLGGKPGAAKLIVDQPSSGSVDQWTYDDGRKENVAVVLEKIRAARPDVLCVAYGAPWQEKWIIENEVALEQAGVRVALVVGGAFEYEAGLVPEVPSWVDQMHLEWLQRLVQEPWRWRRQLRGLKFFVGVLFSGHP